MNALKVVLASMILAVAVTSCSKDQKVVKQLAAGTWEVSAYEIDGESQPAESYETDVYEFEKCRVKRKACDGTYTTVDPTKGLTETAFTYSISDEGEKISITFNVFGLTATESYDIIENSDSKFVWSTTNDFGEDVEITIEKQ